MLDSFTRDAEACPRSTHRRHHSKLRQLAETEIFWDSRRTATWRAPTRAHHQYWNVHGLKNHRSQPKKREAPPSDRSSLTLKGGAEPSFQPSDYTQRTKIEGLRHANSHQNLSLSNLLPKLQPVAHTPAFFLCFFSPHSSPFCDSPSTVRERLSLAATASRPFYTARTQ